MSSSQAPTIELVFEPTLKLPDEVLNGIVQLRFPNLTNDKIEEVHVKLRGTAYTEISRAVGTSAMVFTQRIHLAKENISLWSSSNSDYRPPGSDILKIPFTFTLPSTLLPSFDFGGISAGERVRIRYAIEVVGRRPGRLRRNLRIIMPFPVLPPLSLGAELREAFQSGWNGPWRSTVEKKSIRKGLWGEYSDVAMTFTLPEVEALPVFAPIPFTLTLVTHSKLMKRSEKSEDGTIFPTPPLDPRAIELKLTSDVWIKTDGMDYTCRDKTVTHLGGFGSQESSSGPVAGAVVGPLKKVWVPAEGEKSSEKGRWKQEVAFASSMRFSCAPSFTSETVKLSYKLKLKVDYAGVGNSHTAEVPVQIVSSMYPIGERAWDGPPPEFELPPNYFEGTWEDDPNEKE
ncbi:hypothetical protein BDY19DRAFT_223404 [Irpex rosettiformis]|uniref:Uncharacterized protein n=1 Tax=Irpex rosettiformis TaxID=378272 RepID=A0ACB8U0T9_9APHY|nr:hypothetical protein BDY19DRAFT_223404 [Irpex rosettiformis]